MKKIIFVSLFISVSVWANREAMVKNNLIWPEATGIATNFDGIGFQNSSKRYYTMEQVKANFKGEYRGGTFEYSGGAPTKGDTYATHNLKASFSDSQYSMSAEPENFKGSYGLRYTQAYYDKKSGKLDVKSMTFLGEKLRTITKCIGKKETTVRGKGVTITTSTIDEFCATATAKVCQKLLATYNKESRTNLGLKSADEMEKEVKQCTNIMEGYTKVLESYTSLNDNVRSEFNKVVDAEEDAVKKILGTPGLTSTFHNIGKIRDKDDFKKLTDQLLSSMDGIGKVHQLIDLCQNNIGNFDSDAFDRNQGGIPSEIPPTGADLPKAPR